jgi:hypothetical protein
VQPQDRVTVQQAAQRQQDSRVTILLNKPIGYVSGQAEDGHEPAVTLINPRTHWRDDPSGLRFSPPHLRGLAPAGRLDIDSVGLLVLTQDGRVARQIVAKTPPWTRNTSCAWCTRAGPAAPCRRARAPSRCRRSTSATPSAPTCRRCSRASNSNACATA